MKTKYVFAKTNNLNPSAGRLRTGCAKLLLLLLLTLPAAAQAQDYTYSINGDGTNITITGYAGAGGDVAIPDRIDGLLVTSIGDFAFFNCTSLSSVTINNSITSVGVQAFDYCWNLSSVTIGNSVTNLEDYAFADCTSLSSVTIGNGVTSIGDDAFSDCTILSSITIPDSVTSLGDGEFADDSSLTNAVIGNGVTSLGDNAFSDCINLTGVYYRGDAPSLGGNYVFYNVYSVTNYYLPGASGWDMPTFGGCPTALWSLPTTLDFSSVGVWTNQFGFTITGPSDAVVVVEACTDPANPGWSPVGTNTLTGGSSYFSDPEWMNYPCRFYRLHSQ